MDRSYWVGISARSLGEPRGPLRHAATGTPASPTGYNVLAVCGTSIRPRGDWVNRLVANQRFTGTHVRDCPRCVKVLEKRD